jgi:predicted dehydrogenase
MEGKKKHFLVLGAGSVGKRHLRNFSLLGCELSAFDPRKERLEEAGKQVHLRNSYTDLTALRKDLQEFDGVIVCSPPKFHIEQCIEAIEAEIPVLMEKPLARSYTEALPLLSVLNKYPDSRVLLGYTYRWWPPLAELKSRLEEKAVGQPFHARFVMSAHLVDWHPWERYQDFFMASKDLGGGALLDESHFVDLMLWFFGTPEEVFARVEKITSLEIETDDYVEIIALYADKLRVAIHLDLFGRPHEKDISIKGEKGTIVWSFEPNEIRWSDSDKPDWNRLTFQCERNDMFLNLSKEFIQVVDKKVGPSCTVRDGMNVLKVIEACRLSSHRRSTVLISDLEY